MQIKKRLRIQVAVWVVTTLVICLVFFLSLYRINKVSNLTKIAGDLVTNSLERVTFSNDYIWHNSARAKEQWFVKHKQIGRLLKSASENFRSVEDRYNIGEMIKHHESIGNIFSAIVANREKSSLKPESAELSREFEDRLLNQMNMVIYAVVLHDRELLDSSRKARASVLRQTGESIICLLAIAVALACISSWTMGRTITERVGRLRNGAAMIGGGELDHRIDVKGDDEFTELSEAFNLMTAKLRGSYHILETEIHERKEAEKLVQRHAEELEASIKELTRFNSASMGREIRMIELKKEINELCSQAGEPPRYPLDFEKKQP